MKNTTKYKILSMSLLVIFFIAIVNVQAQEVPELTDLNGDGKINLKDQAIFDSQNFEKLIEEKSIEQQQKFLADHPEEFKQGFRTYIDKPGNLAKVAAKFHEKGEDGKFLVSKDIIFEPMFLTLISRITILS